MSVEQTAPISAMKEAAEAALDRGFFVFALAPRTKIPRPGTHGHLDATAINAEVEALWNENPDFNPAVSCAASGLIVLDYDEGNPPAEINAIRTFKVKTSRGVHVYFWGQMPGTKLYDASGKKIGEIKSSDGYVLAAGARHPSGAIYTVIDDSPVVDAPMDLIAQLTRKPVSENKARDDQGPIPVGQRDNTLMSLAGKLRRAGANQDVIEMAVRQENLKCEVPLEEKDIVRIAKSASRYEKGPIGPTVLIGGKDPETGVQVTAPSTSTNPTPTPVDWRTAFKTVDELEDGGVQMIIEGFLPAGTDLFGSLAGHGKTFVCLSITKALVTGQPFVGNFNVPQRIPVLYLIPESSGRAFKTRLKKFSIPNDPDWFLCRTISEGPTLRLNDPLILEAVKQMKPVVILDTLIRFSEASDENAAAQNKQLCDDIIRLRQLGAVAIIAIHHSPKMSANEEPTLENTLRGTGDFGALADAVYHIRKEELDAEESLKTTCVKPRDFDPPSPFRLVMRTRSNDGQILSTIDTAGDFEYASHSVDLYNKRSALAKAVAENPTVSAENLAQRLKISRNKIPDMLQELGWEKKTSRAPWTRVIVPDSQSPTSFDGDDEDDDPNAKPQNS